MRKVVVYMADSRIYHMMNTAAKSLLKHNKVDRVYFLTDTDTFPFILPDVIKCVNVHNQSIFKANNPNMNAMYGYMTLMRAALSKVFPDEHRVLLLDPDTIVCDDISPIWDTDINDYYFAAVKETRNNTHTKIPYFNAGVMLMNLDKLRNDHMDDIVINVINSKYYTHMEQDVLNYICDTKILPLPSEYNASFVSDPTEHPRIMHFLSRAKQDFYKYGKPYDELSWEDILK